MDDWQAEAPEAREPGRVRSVPSSVRLRNARLAYDGLRDLDAGAPVRRQQQSGR